MSRIPPLLSLEQVQSRLSAIFPESFPDRTILVGDLSARTHFVGLYGGFVYSASRFFRPSTVIRFGPAQAEQTTEEARLDWLARCQAPGFTPAGKSWYADNSRETLRDDLIRNRCVPMGIIRRRDGMAPTSPAPIYAFDDAYLSLFDPNLNGDELIAAIKVWQDDALDAATLARIRLLASGVLERAGEVLVKLPTVGKTLRLAPGEASLITRDVCEQAAPLLCGTPVVVHISMSDRKTFPELADEARSVGLKLDPTAALPDVIIFDIKPKKGRLVFIEVVHSDGPITELRKTALVRIAADMGFTEEQLTLVTAFEDRSSEIARKRQGELAKGSWVWYRSEPYLFMHLKTVEPNGSIFDA